MADVYKNRWLKEVPANLCLLYLSHLPFQFQIQRPDQVQYAAFFRDNKGRFFSYDTISQNCFFRMDDWIHRRYHTLFLYSFAWISSFIDPQLLQFTLHIVPSTGLSSFWYVYFAGSIGGALGKVCEYYYGLHRIFKDRNARQEKYNFEDIATKQMQIAMGEANDTENMKKQAYNLHDYIGDELLNKLYVSSNAKQPLFGPENAIFAMTGYSAALSGHYLFKQMSKYLMRRINDMSNDDEIEEEETKGRDILEIIKGYKQSMINFYHLFVFGMTSMKIRDAVNAYLLQMKEKSEEKGGYAWMTVGKGKYGVDFSILAACGSGILAYPIVLKYQKLKKAKAK